MTLCTYILSYATSYGSKCSGGMSTCGGLVVIFTHCNESSNLHEPVTQEVQKGRLWFNKHSKIPCTNKSNKRLRICYPTQCCVFSPTAHSVHWLTSEKGVHQFRYFLPLSQWVKQHTMLLPISPLMQSWAIYYFIIFHASKKRTTKLI